MASSAHKDGHTLGEAARRCWALVLRCEGAGCGRQVTWRTARLATLPPKLTIAALARAAECGACGHVGAFAHYVQDHGATREADYARLEAKAAARPRWTPSK